MNAHHAANFLMEMGDDIKEIKEIVSRPSETAEQNTENARKVAQLQAAIEETLHVLNDINTRYSARVSAAITKLEVALDDDVPF